MSLRHAWLGLLMLAWPETSLAQSDVAAPVRLFRDVCMSSFIDQRGATLEGGGPAVAARIDAAFTAAGMPKVEGQTDFWRGLGQYGQVSATHCEVALSDDVSAAAVERELMPHMTSWTTAPSDYGGKAWVSDRFPGYAVDLSTDRAVTLSVTFTPTLSRQIRLFQAVCLEPWVNQSDQDVADHLTEQGLRKSPTVGGHSDEDVWRGRGFEVSLSDYGCAVTAPTSAALADVEQALRPRLSGWRQAEGEFGGRVWVREAPGLEFEVSVRHTYSKTTLGLSSRDVMPW